MEMKEELSALNEEALEKVVGGTITTEGDDPAYPGTNNNNNNEKGGLDPGQGECSNLLKINTALHCSLAPKYRTKPECANCSAQGIVW